MRESRVRFHWEERNFHAQFRTGVSLHSHTLHSRESLDFIGRATAGTPWLSGAIAKQMEIYKAKKGRDLNLKRAWWTPPLSGLHAWKLEKEQIERTLDRAALVSLTDHDNLDAGLHLRMLDETRHFPVSVEWTVPWRETFFHLGLHNLPAQEAPELMRDLQALTANPREAAIGEMLERVAADAETLVVFNHPLWDENHIGAELHRQCVNSFFSKFGEFVHALELNGLRPWTENRAVVEMARVVSLPVISGGDRHGREPNACLNLTNAETFAEFVEEVRYDGWSDVLFMPQYREPFKLRILTNMRDIIDDDPNHSLGWTHWSQRVFYQGDDDVVKSLHEIWGGKFPAVITHFIALMGLMRSRRIRSALRFALTQKQEFAL